MDSPLIQRPLVESLQRSLASQAASVDRSAESFGETADVLERTDYEIDPGLFSETLNDDASLLATTQRLIRAFDRFNEQIKRMRVAMMRRQS